MAYYKYLQFLERRSGVEFDDIHPSDTPAPLSGLYRCEICGGSVVASRGTALPGRETHADHSDGQPIVWRLVVQARWK